MKLRDHWNIAKAVGFRYWPLSLSRFMHEFIKLNLELDRIEEEKNKLDLLTNIHLIISHSDIAAKHLDSLREVLYPINENVEELGSIVSRLLAFTGTNPYWIGYEWQQDELQTFTELEKLNRP